MTWTGNHSLDDERTSRVSLAADMDYYGAVLRNVTIGANWSASNESVFSETYLLNVSGLTDSPWLTSDNTPSTSYSNNKTAHHTINIWEAGKVRIPLYRFVRAIKALLSPNKVVWLLSLLCYWLLCLSNRSTRPK